MIERTIETPYPHNYDVEGRKLDEPCLGYIDLLVDSRYGVISRCNLCGETYKLQFVYEPTR